MGKKYVSPQINEVKVEMNSILSGSCNHDKCYATDGGANCPCGSGNCHCHDHNVRDAWADNDELFDEQ